MDVRFDDGTSVRIENIRPDQDSHDVTEGCVLLKRVTFSPEEYKDRVSYFADCVAFLWDRSGSPGHVSMLCSSFFLCGCERTILDLWDVYLEFSREFGEYDNAYWYVTCESRPRYGRVDHLTAEFDRLTAEFELREQQVTERFKTALVCALART